MQVKRKAPMEKTFKAIAGLYEKDPATLVFMHGWVLVWPFAPVDRSMMDGGAPP
jgi:hypothetical protein